MIIKLRIKGFSINWVFRHRWEKERGIVNYTVWEMRNNYKLGIWFKISKIIGSIKKRPTREETVSSTFNESNHVNSYQIGLNLLVCKTWIEFSFKPILKI